MTASLENRRSYVPRTGVYEETRRLTSSKKKRKKKLNCSVKCAGQFKPKALGLYLLQTNDVQYSSASSIRAGVETCPPQ